MQKLARELELWRKLGGECKNIIELLGVITGIGPLPSPVCELCTWNLQSVGAFARCQRELCSLTESVGEL